MQAVNFVLLNKAIICMIEHVSLWRCLLVFCLAVRALFAPTDVSP